MEPPESKIEHLGIIHERPDLSAHFLPGVVEWYYLKPYHCEQLNHGLSTRKIYRGGAAQEA